MSDYSTTLHFVSLQGNIFVLPPRHGASYDYAELTLLPRQIIPGGRFDGSRHGQAEGVYTGEALKKPHRFGVTCKGDAYRSREIELGGAE